MIKANLKAIKNDMWDVLYNKKYLNAELKNALKEVEATRKEWLAEYEQYPEDDWHRIYWSERTNQTFDEKRGRVISELTARYHNDQSYYLIYKDGSETVITAEEILGGAKFPKMSDVVYAEMSSADDHFDTETGDLNWYSDEAMEACGWDYEVEDAREWQYETAIQFKFGTEWSRRWKREHPDFIPQEI